MGDGDGGEQHQRQGPPSIHSNANGQDSGSRSEDDDDAPRESVRRGTSGRSFIAEDSGEGRSRHQSRHGGSRSIQYQPSRHTPSRTSQHPLSHIEESRASQQQPSHTPSRTSQHQQHQPSLTHTISRGSGHHSRDMTGLQYSRDDNTRPDRSRHGTRSESIREIGSSRSNNLRITEGES